jgi:AraC-type transcriptional regulator N-terminus
MTSGYLPSTVGGGDLVAELASIATQAGPNTGLWPGLTIYRFTAPAGPTWEEIQSLSLCIVAQGRKAVTVGGETYMYDPFRYLVLSSHLHFQAEILEATIGSAATSGSPTPDSTSRSSRRTGIRRTPIRTGCRGSSTIPTRTRITWPRWCAPSPATSMTSG